MTARAAAQVPADLRFAARRAHLRWLMRKWRADVADRAGWRFVYDHPAIGAFVYHPADWLSRRLYLYGAFEPVELRFAIEQASAGGLIVDVGANIGLFTVACARAAGARGRVLALEPGPRTFDKLTRTRAALGLTNVTARQVAAGAVNGELWLADGPSGEDVHQHLADGRSDARSRAVGVVRLDDLCGREVADVVLLKIDVEGHELEVLDGAAGILAVGRAALIVELYPQGLAAAGASVEALWSRLDATHRCLAVICQDGTVMPPELQSTFSAAAGEAWNTLWLSRRGRERS